MGNLSTPDSVQKLQTALHAKANVEPGYRFYVLYDKISRDDILAHAYAQCRSNKGAPGVDRQDFEAVEMKAGVCWGCRSSLMVQKTASRPLHTHSGHCAAAQRAGHIDRFRYERNAPTASVHSTRAGSGRQLIDVLGLRSSAAPCLRFSPTRRRSAACWR